MTSTDVFAGVIQQAVEAAMRNALNIDKVTNRRMLSVEEAGMYLAVSKREVFNMIANRLFPAVKHGRRTMIDIRDLDTWIEENKR